MPVKISCPSCGAQILNTFEAYADHILKEHNDNLELCTWAREELIKIGKINNEKKFKDRGKFADRIPLKRKRQQKPTALIRQETENRQEVTDEDKSEPALIHLDYDYYHRLLEWVVRGKR